mgnify:CR=1 FL=1
MTSPNSTAKTIVITGASGGLGAAAARQLHRTRPQDNLVIIGRNPEKTRAVAGPPPPMDLSAPGRSTWWRVSC